MHPAVGHGDRADVDDRVRIGWADGEGLVCFCRGGDDSAKQAEITIAAQECAQGHHVPWLAAGCDDSWLVTECFQEKPLARHIRMLSAQDMRRSGSAARWARGPSIPKRLRRPGQTRYFRLAPAIGGLSTDPVSSGRARSVDGLCPAVSRPRTQPIELVATSTYRCANEGSVGVTATVVFWCPRAHLVLQCRTGATT
ncbi:Uncharacterised protein [Mycobacteroides abscessus subsp. abscessus]|nr:Uncharacterised protein [Mycobacteroides abscessus subsp. abscessus]